MKIVFKSTGDNTGFENWLKSFKEINDSLLIEVDVENKCFITKTYTTEKTIVKYGSLTFEQANYEVESSDEFNGRVYVGVFQYLDKFIRVVNSFVKDDHTLTIEFDDNGKGQLVASSITFKSNELQMILPGSIMDEFVIITDDQFKNNIATIDAPMCFNVSNENVKKLLDYSSIMSSDAKKDVLAFDVVEENGKYVLVASDNNSKSFHFKVGLLDEGTVLDDADISNAYGAIIRNNFILTTKNDTEESKLIISRTGVSNKIRIDSGESFITIISKVRISR